MDAELNYISLQEATKFCEYTQEYLSLRARQGKLKAVKFGRNWLTKEEWLQEYLGKVGEYNNHFNNGFKINHLGLAARPPENLPIEPDAETVIRIKLNSPPPPKFYLPALRPIFSLGLVFILLAANIALGKEDLFRFFKTADYYSAKLGQAGKTIFAQGREGVEIIFFDPIKGKIISAEIETRNLVLNIKNQVSEIGNQVSKVFPDISSMRSDITAMIGNLDFGIAQIGEGAGENLKSYFSWL